MVKPGAIVIDVGMNRDDEGKLCGDVDFAGVREVAGTSPRCRAASAR
jgi:methylenetetrahydrofolate dehydrogenase (NADP+)/methenyltetrahydrofolate cyclohydrolase